MLQKHQNKKYSSLPQTRSTVKLISIESAGKSATSRENSR